MTNEERRAAILRALSDSKRPITGAQFSGTFGVTRQVIVADVAILRARNEPIVATTQGYIILYASPGTVVRQTIAARHSASAEDLQAELYTIVDNGGTVLDVTVEHPVYGEITGTLRLSSRAEIDMFIAKLTQAGAEPLLVLTGGLHLHTVEGRDEQVIERVLHALAANGYLADERHMQENPCLE
ncbi:MAG: putative transcription repressor NiaR [Firmicutes bacterium]|nr:putative transcription repressor NiaR [candidate division NPL-UPA2 bacterium]